jgi:hypothetical protein
MQIPYNQHSKFYKFLIIHNAIVINGVSDLRRCNGRHAVTKGEFVTFSTFTKDCENFSQVSPKYIRLINGNELVELIQSQYRRPHAQKHRAEACRSGLLQVPGGLTARARTRCPFPAPNSRLGFRPRSMAAPFPDAPSGPDVSPPFPAWSLRRTMQATGRPRSHSRFHLRR